MFSLLWDAFAIIGLVTTVYWGATFGMFAAGAAWLAKKMK